MKLTMKQIAINYKMCYLIMEFYGWWHPFPYYGESLIFL